MAVVGNTDGKLVNALKSLWALLAIDGDLTGGLWWNAAPEIPSGPYAVLESDTNTKVIVTSEGAIYRWEFTINIFLKRPDDQTAFDAEAELSDLVESVDRIAGNRLTVAGKSSSEIGREDDATFNTNDENIVQAQVKYKVIH